MTIENGNVVVIRDNETIRGLFYRKFYNEIEQLAQDVQNFIADKEIASPNISVMKINDSRFCILEDEDEDFRLEFFPLLAKLGFTGYCMCEHCDKPLFVWLDKPYKAYCHGCREMFEGEGLC